ncbi:MAG: Hpt domain-containing protein [Epsilonproteobacteria bacterium]|nr:Hpt domain-containing protein [Campylobacterota bacterium]
MNDVTLPCFKYIDTDIGLKYLNNNRELYLKILRNFLNRYSDLDLKLLEDGELKDAIHSIKGLSSTLGMVTLSRVATTIHDTKDMGMLPEFRDILSLTIDELRFHLEESSIKSILLIDDKIVDIDILIELLGDRYDIAVALDERGALEILDSEEISVVLFDIDTALDIERVYIDIIERGATTIFILEDDSGVDRLKRLIYEDREINYIVKPFTLKKIEESLSKI